MLSEVEKLRKELLKKVVELTGLSVDEITIEISISSNNDSELAIEARDLDWHTDRHNESAWYTSEIPQGGSTTIYVE